MDTVRPKSQKPGTTNEEQGASGHLARRSLATRYPNFAPLFFPPSAGGTATLELVLVLPVILFLVLLLVQTMLLFSGNLFVHYAAQSATRSAVVQIPADYSREGGLGPNLFEPEPGLPKYEAIRRAAAFSVVPISGRLAAGGHDGSPFADALGRHFADYGRTSPNWTRRLAADQLRYADANTTVRLWRTSLDDLQDVSFSPIGGTAKFDFKDPLTVEVQHDMSLTIPLAAFLFADARHDQHRGRGFYTRVTARHTLNNEGIAPDLPPLPALTRQP